MGATAVVQQITWEEALRAGRVLFGTQADALLAGAGWRDELRRAYKRRVLETHPDRARTLGRAEAELAREFQVVADAYRLLQEAPEASRWVRASPRPAASWRPAASTSSGGEQRARRAEAAGRSEAARREAAARKVEEAARAESAARARRVWTATEPDWRSEAKARPLPRRPIRLAEFLYYSGRISWAAMVEAIAWQRSQRPAVGKIAVDYGFLTPVQVMEVIARRRQEGANGVPFGEFALRIGLITPFERLAMVGRQTRLQRPIGQFFVERGMIVEPEFEGLRRQIVRHNLRHYA